MDEADHAQDFQARFNADAIARARTSPVEIRIIGNGICIDCGEPIERRRLQVCPDTPRCRQCQSDCEKAKERRGRAR